MKRLLIRPGAIGDFIVSLPALESLRGTYTEIWCRSEVFPLIWFADKCVSLAGVGIDRVGLTEDADVIERMRWFDEIHSWYGTNRPEFREACRGLPISFYAPLPPDGTQHAADFYLEQVGQPIGAVPTIRLVAPAVLHPFSGSARKNWNFDHWAELARLLERRMPVQWCRGPDDDLAGAIAIADLGELARWIGTARVFIGNDSGVSHLAAAVGVPTIVLFGETNPLVWAPRGNNIRVFPFETSATTIAEAVL